MLGRTFGWALALWALSGSAVARPAGGASVTAERPLARLRLSIERAQLKNGLRVVMDVDHDTPGVALAVVYRVGARNEQPNQYGFAAWIERAMFGGSRHIKPGELLKRVRAAGGQAGSVASPETTTYFEVLPASELALGLWLEADRMRSVSLDRASLDRARQAVDRARRNRSVDDLARLRLRQVAFEDAPTHGHDPLGTAQALARATPRSVRAFHNRYYAPNNAVLSVAGDIDADQVMALVHRYFDVARAVEQPAPTASASLRQQSSERLAVLHARGRRTPELVSGWVLPPAHATDRNALELALRVLASGPSSRLGWRLVHLARSVDAEAAGSLLSLRVVLADNVLEPAVEKALKQEVRELGRHGPHTAELKRAKAGLETDWLLGLESNLHRALALGRTEALAGNARLYTRELDASLRVTPKEVQRAVKNDLVAQRHTLIEVYPLRTATTRSKRFRRRHALERARRERSAARTPKPRRRRNGSGARASRARQARRREQARRAAAARRRRDLAAKKKLERAAAARRRRDLAAKKKLERAAALRKARARAAERRLAAARARRQRAAERRAALAKARRQRAAELAKRRAERRAQRSAQRRARAQRQRARSRAAARAKRRRTAAAARRARARARAAKLRARAGARNARRKKNRSASQPRKKPTHR